MLKELLAKAPLAQVPARRDGPRPKEYAHIVLKTAQADAMIDWYCNVIGMSVVMRTPLINFLTWDESQDRLAIMQVPPEKASKPENSNLHHIAFAYEKIAEIISIYRAVAKDGIKPHWSVNHGVATSLYFHDPDGNSVELSVENFSDVSKLNEWLATGAFNKNPVGITIDADELARRVESGEAEETLRRPHPDHATGLDAELARHQPKT